MIAAVRSSAVLLLAVCVLCTSLSTASGMMVQRWNFESRNCTGPYTIEDDAAIGQCQGSGGFFFAYSSCDAAWLYQYQHIDDATCSRASRAALPSVSNTYTCTTWGSGSYLLACEGIARPSADSADSSTGDDHSDVFTSSGAGETNGHSGASTFTSSGADEGDAHSSGSSSTGDHSNTYTSSGTDGGTASSSTAPCQDFECAATALAPSTSVILVAALIATARAAL